MYSLLLRRRELTTDGDGYANWTVREEEESFNPSESALIIVDMWDRHWSSGATARCAAIADKIDAAARRARDRGLLIVHAPSDTMDFYKETEARGRLLAQQPIKDIPEVREIKEYPQPVDSSDGGSDTGSVDLYKPDTVVWTCQTEKIYIDHSKDIIGDEGDLIFSYLSERNIKNIIYAGVHTNMCILHRPLAIKSMLRRGMKTILCRDLTDCMYNPAKPPYVSHDDGTKLVIEYIEKFYCPKILGEYIK